MFVSLAKTDITKLPKWVSSNLQLFTHLHLLTSRKEDSIVPVLFWNSDSSVLSAGSYQQLIMYPTSCMLCFFPSL